MTEVTQILEQIEHGDRGAADQLMPLVYQELRRLASAKLAKEPPGQTIQATALVHDAYIRLVDAEKAQQWNSRGHFFAAAAEAMRRILVENARRRKSAKRGGAMRRVDLDVTLTPVDGRSPDLLALDEALRQLEREAPEKAELVKLRFFCGLSIDEASAALGVSSPTAKRHWTYARAWLYGQMKTS